MSLIHAFTTHAFRSAPRFCGRAIRASKFPKAYHAAERMEGGCRIVTIQREPHCRQHILFLHGGGYVLEATALHRRLLRTLANLGFRSSFIDYPLAPAYTAADTLPAVLGSYRALQQFYPEDTFYLLGDSAGGGLAAALLLMMRDQGISPCPQKTVLLSPWLDVSMQNPDMQAQRRRDKLLPYDALLEAGQQYAGAPGVDSPYVSPLKGELHALGQLLLFYSSNELLAPDCRRFAQLAQAAAGTRLESCEVPGLFHDYALLPFLRESKAAYSKIAAFFKE